ncbi:hypothetical protein GCK72_021852 [Caenorhabditis remanei]|uniref:Uncharacterized protein n=1 Tax=Caenorhabditis remanei TaxID=31234 RepID=A0A6A5GKW2_CAERE|nr:hypothetical protein GCK72_021852 [Caenorhabditis remanei]KAF1755283.1 hypothetical protein GCK72_021852 [Caenorhabditis remanei]
MELMKQLETGGIQSDEHGVRGSSSPLGRTSMTQEYDGQLAALELACAKATFPLGSENRESIRQRCQAGMDKRLQIHHIPLTIKLLTVTNNYRVEMENRLV